MPFRSSVYAEPLSHQRRQYQPTRVAHFPAAGRPLGPAQPCQATPPTAKGPR